MNLQNHFLIAMPGLPGGMFAQSVAYICEHTAEGALGFVINRPSSLTLSDVYKQMELDPISPQSSEQRVFAGGPVQIEKGFVLHRTCSSIWKSSLNISEDIQITTSRDILEDLARTQWPAHHLLLLGYAGWNAGQLEDEIKNNQWLVSAADPDIIFEVPTEQRWQAAAKLIGVDFNYLSTDVGHA